jgi:hypothetical protein
MLKVPALASRPLGKQLINYSKAVMSHSRDITVIHTIDKRIFFDIPLYFEKGMQFKNIRIEGGRMVIEAIKQKSSDTNNERLL